VTAEAPPEPGRRGRLGEQDADQRKKKEAQLRLDEFRLQSAADRLHKKWAVAKDT
jgi:hypothetical protein